MNEARSRLARIAAAPDDQIDLAEAALVIALEEYPDLRIDEYLDRLDELAELAGAVVRGDEPRAEQIASLNRFLFLECGFRGNEEDYYDPRNSFLNEVLDRRTGIPITLSVIYTEVGRRLRLPLTGVGFPGHFLVKHTGSPEILIDPFGQRVLTRREAEQLNPMNAGASSDDLFRAASSREILVRMLRNLKNVYLQRNDPIHALSATDRILLLDPDRSEELRDRGVLYIRLECFAAALRDFERCLEVAPEGESARRIRAALPELRLQVSRLQ